MNKNSDWYKEQVLTSDSYTPVSVAEIGKYKWPYTDIGIHITGLAREAKDRGKEVFCVKVEYCGTEKREECVVHHARCTVYLTPELCEHNNIEQCIETLEKWRVGPCHPQYDGDASMIVYMTREYRSKVGVAVEV